MLWINYYWHKVLKRPYTLSRRIDSGRGQPVVLLHGLAATGENWQYLADRLDKKKYRVIALDLLGFGDSPQPDWLEYSVDDHAKAVLATLRRLRIRGPVILVGHSMGSLVAAHIARTSPKKVKHLILYQMPVYGEIPNVRLKDFRRQAYLYIFRYFAEHPKITLWYARALSRLAARVGFLLDETTWQPFELSLKNTIMQQQSYEHIRELIIPTDVIYGRYDVLVLKKNMQHFFRPAPYLRFYEIDELHRISDRAGELMQQLIVHDPKHRPEIDVKHARLVELIAMEKLNTSKPMMTRLSRKWLSVVCAVSLLSLIVFASWAWHGRLPIWEQTMFMWLNGWQAPSYVEFIARVSSDIVWFAVFVVAALFLIPRYRVSAWRVGVPAAAVYVCIYITEHIVARGRPEVLLQSDVVLRASQDGYGFPSGHMAVMTMIVLVLWLYMRPPIRWLALTLLVLVGWSRIFLGVHFPLDIAGGLVVATGLCAAYMLLPLRWRKRVGLA